MMLSSGSGAGPFAERVKTLLSPQERTLSTRSV